MELNSAVSKRSVAGGSLTFEESSLGIFKVIRKLTYFGGPMKGFEKGGKLKTLLASNNKTLFAAGKGRFLNTKQLHKRLEYANVGAYSTMNNLHEAYSDSFQATKILLSELILRDAIQRISKIDDMTVPDLADFLALKDDYSANDEKGRTIFPWGEDNLFWVENMMDSTRAFEPDWRVREENAQRATDNLSDEEKDMAKQANMSEKEWVDFWANAEGEEKMSKHEVSDQELCSVLERTGVETGKTLKKLILPRLMRQDTMKDGETEMLPPERSGKSSVVSLQSVESVLLADVSASAEDTNTEMIVSSQKEC